MGVEKAADDVAPFFDEVASLMLDGDPRLRLVGGEDLAVDHLCEFGDAYHPRVWNMQYTLTLRGIRATTRLNEESRRRGTDLRLVVPRAALRRSPLHLCLSDPLRVGPVPAPMLYSDSAAFFSGPLGTRIAFTFWRTEDPLLLERARQAFLQVWDSAVPAEEAVGRSPLPPRTTQVALHLLDGAADKEIAAALGVSERTVSAEVRRVVTWLGARSRGHAVAMLAGAA